MNNYTWYIYFVTVCCFMSSGPWKCTSPLLLSSSFSQVKSRHMQLVTTWQRGCIASQQASKGCLSLGLQSPTVSLNNTHLHLQLLPATTYRLWPRGGGTTKMLYPGWNNHTSLTVCDRGGRSEFDGNLLILKLHIAVIIIIITIKLCLQGIFHTKICNKVFCRKLDVSDCHF